MIMKIYIEQLSSSSIELIKPLNKLLKQLDNAVTSLTKEDLKQMITSSAHRLFVARRLENKEIIGMLTMVVFRIPFAKKGLLEDLVVDKQYRGKGVGTKLITTAINKACKERVAYLDFTSRPTRVAANKLYQRLGFKKRDTNIYRIILQHGV